MTHIIPQSEYERSISDDEIHKELSGYKHHDLTPNIITDPAAEARIIIPAIKRDFIAAAIWQDPQYTAKLKTLGQGITASNWKKEFGPDTCHIEYENQEFITDFTMETNKKICTLLTTTSAKLTSLFGANAEMTGRMMLDKPVAGLSGINPHPHTDPLDEITINTSSYGAPMIWHPSIDGRINNNLALANEQHPQAFIQNKIGDVMAFNKRLIHSSSPDVKEKGAMNTFLDYLQLNAAHPT